MFATLVPVFFGFFLVLSTQKASAERVPLWYMPPNVVRGCGPYSAGQGAMLVKPPAITGGQLDYRDQNVAVSPGQTINLEFVIYAQTCVPTSPFYPQSTGYYFGTPSINNGAAISASVPPISILTYSGDVNYFDIIRYPVSVTIPSNAPDGLNIYEVTFPPGQKINRRRDGSFQCVLFGGARSNYTRVSDYNGCAVGAERAAIGVEVRGLQGSLDGLSCDAISGWAFDRDNPSASVDIHVYRTPTDGRNIGPTTVFRPDVNNAYGISGNHGYFWSLPPEWKDGQTTGIAVFAINLPGTPGTNRLIGLREYPSNCNQNWDLDVDVTCDVQNGILGFTITKSGTVQGNITVTRNASLTNPAQNIPIPALTLTNASFSGNTWSQTVPFSAVLGQSVNASISVSPGGGTNGNPSNDSATCNDGPKVAKPYFRSYGGDVVVGRNFVNNGSCSATQPSSSIKAFTRQNGTDFAGSGSEFAARATDVIEGFLSASTRTSNPVSPNGLSFGNRTGVGSDQSAYTGCIPDYWNEYIQGKYPDQATLDKYDLNKNGNNLGPRANNQGEWGDPINGITINTTNSGYYFYDGDLTITGNVTLASYGFDANSPTANLNQIPKFVLIVKGNINIAPNVTQLQGVFIAQENPDPTITTPTGIINTCAGPGVNWQQCFAGPKLEVQGSFIAKEVKLNRLRGDIAGAGVREGSDAPQAAEVFIFRPDLLLSTAGDEQNPSTKITDYDSIVGLPPVL